MANMPYSSGNFALFIDTASGSAHEFESVYIKSLTGGDIKANTSTQKVGGTEYSPTDNSTVEIEPFSAEVGMAVTKPILQWINDSWDRKYSRRNGAWHVADQRFETRYIRNFQNALVVETTLPGLDASKGAFAYLKLKIQPETIKDEPGDGKRIQSTVDPKQSLWSTSNFRVTLDSSKFDSACDYIDKVDEISIKQNCKNLWVGAERFPTIEPTNLELPKLSFYLPASHAKPFFDWHKESVIKGKSVSQLRYSGCIEYLDHETRKTLLELEMYDMGISSCKLDKAEANTDQIQKAKVELFVHRYKLKFG